MKTLLQSASLLLAGSILLSACTDEKTGESPEKIAENIELDTEEMIQDAAPTDTVEVEDSIVPPPPPPLPEPPPPAPIPEPYWEPEPYPEPEPPEPIPLPEPPPYPEPKPTPVIIDFPDVEPKFPGGEAEMMKFISSNIEYPQEAIEMNEFGRVYLEFVVEKDGSLTNVRVIRGVSASLDREAKRVIRRMPKWTPGEAGGRIVRTKMRLPISFHMD